MEIVKRLSKSSNRSAEEGVAKYIEACNQFDLFSHAQPPRVIQLEFKLKAAGLGPTSEATMEPQSSHLPFQYPW